MNESFVIVGMILILSLCLGLTRPKYLLYAAIFFLPWQGLDFEIGIRMTVYRIVIGILLLVSLGNLCLKPRQRGTFPIVGALALFFFYAVGLSLVKIPGLPEAEVAGGVFRGPEVRAVLQIVLFCVVFVGPFLVAPLYLKSPNDYVGAGKIYLGSLLILAFLGWFQLLSWYGTGWNPFPIGLTTYFGGDLSLQREGTFVFFGLPINRMSALGGEPKNLGQGLAVGLILIQVLLGTIGSRRGDNRLRLAWIVLFISMVFTYSTSAFFLWVIGSSVQLAFYIMQHNKMQRFSRYLKNITIMTVMVLLTAILGLVVSKNFLSSLEITDLFAARTYERINLEDFDEAIFSFLIHEPEQMVLGVGMGNVHLYADRYLPIEAVPYARGTAFRAKAGTLKLMSEFGPLGFLLWTVAFISQLKAINSAKQMLRENRYQSSLDAIASASFLLGSSLFIVYFFFLGIEEFLLLAFGINGAIILSIKQFCILKTKRFITPDLYRY
jgi:hypothetical protein